MKLFETILLLLAAGIAFGLQRFELGILILILYEMRYMAYAS